MGSPYSRRKGRGEMFGPIPLDRKKYKRTSMASIQEFQMTQDDCKMLDKIEDRGSYDHVAFNIKHAKNF